MDMNLSKLPEIVREREAWHASVHGIQRVGHNLVTEQQVIRGKRQGSGDGGLVDPVGISSSLKALPKADPSPDILPSQD